MLEDLAKKAVSILTKAEILDEKVKEIRLTLTDHERRLCKLEGMEEATLSKIEAAFQTTKVALLEMRR